MHVDIEIHGEDETVVFKVKPDLALRPTETRIPWEALETAYLGLLQARQMQKAARQKIAIAGPAAIPSQRPN